MKHPLLPLEPVIWLLFGLGIMVGTMLLTAWAAVVGLGAPLGWVPADALAFERAHALGSTLVGRLVLAGVVALPLWKGAHHTRHAFIDAGGGERDGVVAPILYLIASAGSVLAIVAAFRI
jgi:fumarate reductase subunit D